MINLKHLYYFHVFANELSTTRAAQSLRISSPALSNQLKQLGHFLGVSLIRRTEGKFRLTAKGEMLKLYTDRMFFAYEELCSKLGDSHGFMNSGFKVGIENSLGAQFSFDLVSLIEDTSLKMAKEIHFDFDESEHLLEAFRGLKFEMVIGSFKVPPGDSDLSVSQNLDFPVRLFFPLTFLKQGEWKSSGNINQDVSNLITLANQNKISFVYPHKNSVLYFETQRFISGLNVKPERTIECNHSAAIVQRIERGLAFGFLPIPCFLDFKTAKLMAVLGPPDGYWNHRISVMMIKTIGKLESKGQLNCKIPIYLLTGQAPQRLVYPFEAVIEKPFDLLELKRIIAERLHVICA